MYGLEVPPPSSSASSSPSAKEQRDSAVAANDAIADIVTAVTVDDDVDAADTAKLLPSPPGDHSKVSCVVGFDSTKFSVEMKHC